MNIREALMQDRYPGQATGISDYIGADQQKFDALMKVFSEQNILLSQRASWVLCITGSAAPQLLIPHYKQLLGLVSEGLHEGIKRNVLKLLAVTDLPDDLLGEAVNLGFHELASPTSAIAVKVHAMTLLYHISLRHADLQDELALHLENQLEQQSPAYRSRALKILRKLEKAAARKDSARSIR